MSDSERLLAATTIDWENAYDIRRDPQLQQGGPFSLDDAVRGRLAASETLEEAARVLYHLLFGGYSVWIDGRLLFTKALVENVGTLRVEIFLREHAPPHFHVTAPGINASFAIADCATLQGSSLTESQKRMIEYWHVGAKPRLVRTWNKTRPSDCPVGPIDEG